MRQDLKAIGERLALIRGQRSQAEFAPVVGIHKNTLGTYERGERELGASALMGYARLGWNINWVLMGDGPDRLETLQDNGFAADETADAAPSQPPRLESLTLAIQLAEEALDGGRLEPADYAQLVSLIHDALVNGLPSAQVLAFARPAARGIGETEYGRRDVGGSGKKAAR
ncbi:helix-turn-helix domain-containing protein [Xanthomonas euvesicatoria pv. allii]|uniref:helix-turn-helix domain-containing protein n=1 Tax=Xanthomonas euvesicatoria TaxID=456327 RepID=UPI002406A7EE|nr:helix-turn-helix transcriptional regulator [Xanthomonas euvesicatoria]MCP3048365.1 helix-turn-helix domain-containing protein [Xanthomonas euvesicatoria pv. allii]